MRFFNGKDILSLGNNKYLLQKVIPDDAIKGFWYFNMDIYDNADNSKFYQKNANQFFVNGVSSDIDKFPPIITSVTMFPDTITEQIDSIILNIDKIDFKNSLHIYPNPFNDIVNIVFEYNSFNDALLKIYNINGNLIYEKMISSNTAIDLSHFSKGTYCFVMINDKYIISRLVIKK